MRPIDHKSNSKLLTLLVLSAIMILNSATASPSGTDFAKMFGLVYNTKYTGAIIDSTLSLSQYYNITDTFTRNLKFQKPPASVATEVENDAIDDEWDYSEDQSE